MLPIGAVLLVRRFRMTGICSGAPPVKKGSRFGVHDVTRLLSCSHHVAASVVNSRGPMNAGVAKRAAFYRHVARDNSIVNSATVARVAIVPGRVGNVEFSMQALSSNGVLGALRLWRAGVNSVIPLSFLRRSLAPTVASSPEQLERRHGCWRKESHFDLLK